MYPLSSVMYMRLGLTDNNTDRPDQNPCATVAKAAKVDGVGC